MKQKKTVIGWIGKRDDFDYTLDDNGGEYRLWDVYLKRMSKDKWLEEDWPPKKVKITVEEI